MQASPAEFSFLLSVCRLDPHLDIDRQLENLPQNFDWELLVKTSLDHGVTALLCHNLLQASPALVPDDVFQAARIFLDQEQETSQQQADQLIQLVGKLEKNGIHVIPFKGLTLALKIYGQLNLRPSRDIDFLIDENDISDCIENLNTLGYRHDWDLTPRQWREFVRYAGEDILFGPGVPVEPHWAFTPGTLAIELDYASIQARTDRIEFNGLPVLSLSAEDEFIVLCIHGCKEEWSKLKWLVDVSEFIRAHPRLDWNILIGRATSQHVARIVRIGLLLSRELLGTGLPREVGSWADNDKTAQLMASQLAENFFSVERTNLDIWKPGRFHWSMRERLIDRLRYLVLTITQPRVQYFQTIRIPDSLFLLYWPYRILHDYILIPPWRLLKSVIPVKK